MVIAVPKESAPGERRVALTNDGVKTLVADGFEVLVRYEAGYGAAVGNTAYELAGARIVPEGDPLEESADLTLCVNVDDALIERLKPGSAVMGFLNPAGRLTSMARLAERNITAISMELVPRISRAQAMDALSSMSTVAGYKSVVMAAAAIPKFFPMLMTAAGSVPPARVLVIGAGVAGLQAIATARRLGAIVEAFDVRPSVKEQVESLGAKFVDWGLTAEEAEDSGGYAKEVASDTHAHELRIIGERVPKCDVVITTALIPGKPAPVLITEEMVRGMVRGSVIVDLAAVAGGNCEVTKPGETIDFHGVTIIGLLDIASSMAVHASRMYSKNITAFVKSMSKGGVLTIDLEDEVVAGSLVTHDGKVVHAPTRLAFEKGETS
ncbi:MAG: Re/Si-specific NAD(P)(+) transhydrogenase subunit alpha [Armatimonadota bacterium]|nr:Re/Si-specific NAD(P)(+) transhydrogenase subunit alpha [Armatimonadota bacterium]